QVRCSVPAADAIMRDRAIRARVGDEGTATRDAALVLPNGELYPRDGKVDFAQSTIDPDTGTVRLRAVFDNDERRLIPGRVVRVRVRLETRDNAIVMPEEAIIDSQQMTQVYVINDDNEAIPTPVELGPAVEGGRIIEKGPEAGARVVTIGAGSIGPRSKVRIVPASELRLGQPGRQGAAEQEGEAAADKNAGASAEESANAGTGEDTDADEGGDAGTGAAVGADGQRGAADNNGAPDDQTRRDDGLVLEKQGDTVTRQLAGDDGQDN